MASAASLSLQGPSYLLQRTLGVPGLWLGHARSNAKRKVRPPAPSVLERLRRENALDLALHAAAREHSVAMLRQASVA